MPNVISIKVKLQGDDEQQNLISEFHFADKESLDAALVQMGIWLSNKLPYIETHMISSGKIPVIQSDFEPQEDIPKI